MGKKKNIMLMIVFLFSLFYASFSIKETNAIYRDTLHTSISLNIIDENATYRVDFDAGSGSIVTGSSTYYKTYNEALGTLPTPELADYNFVGWYTAADNTGTRIGSGTQVTAPVTYYAHYIKLVCRRAASGTLKTEKCIQSGNAGCVLAGIAQNVDIEYGTLFNQYSPKKGDAFDCDVNNDGTYDPDLERFYLIRTFIDGTERAALVYYTGFDKDGRMDSSTSRDISTYANGIQYLPNSSVFTDWTNPNLHTFNNNKISRYISLDDLEAACGPLQIDVNRYMDSCQYFMETSKFQSDSVGRSGITVDSGGTGYYRIDTRTNKLASVTSTSSNVVKPVIEIPYNMLDGYVEKTTYIVRFHTNGGDSLNDIPKYEDDAIGNLPTPTRSGYQFSGWYYDPTLQTAYDPTDIVTSDIDVYADWEIDTMPYVFYIPGTCTFGGSSANITSASNDCISTINTSSPHQDIDYTATANKYIDTQISLYSQANYEKDYEIGFTIEYYDASANPRQAVFVNTKLENSSLNYPGLVVRKFDNDNTKIEFTETIEGTREAQQLAITSPINSSVNVKIKRENGVISYSYDDGDFIPLQDINNTSDYFNFYTWFGAGGTSASVDAYTSSPNTQRYFSGTLSNLYIKLEREIPRTITFAAYGGTLSIAPDTTITVNHGSTINPLPTATKTGYYFDGWYSNPDPTQGTKYTGAERITADATYHAVYKEYRRITFAAYGGTLSIAPDTYIDVPDGDTIGTLPTVTKAGYHFVGWYSDPDPLQGTQYTGSETISADATYHAVYIEAYRITFAAYGGTLSIAPDTYIDVSPGGTIGTLPTATKAGYQFVGWYSNPDPLQGTQYTGSETINADATYHAVYVELYRITFAAYGGTLSIAPNTYIEVAPGGTIGTLPTATKSGYEFDGWYSDPDPTQGTKYTGNEVINANATYHAVYIEYHRITFYPYGGTLSIAPDTYIDVLDGQTIGTLPTATKSGYQFDGWFDAVSGGTQFTGNEPIYADDDYHAQWTQLQVTMYRVIFDSKGGSSVNDMEVVAGDPLEALPEPPTKTYFNFAGWYEEENYITPVTTSTVPGYDETTYYAKWELDSSYVARIGDDYYTTLMAAVASIDTSNQTTVVLLKNTQTANSNDATLNRIPIPYDRNVIIDFQGYTVSNGYSNSPVFDNEGTLKLMNGTVTSSAGQGAINNNNSGNHSNATLYIENMTVTASGTRQCVYNKGIVEIEDSTFTASSNQRATLQNESGGTMTIINSTVNSTNSACQRGGVQNAGTLYVRSGTTITSVSTNSTVTSGVSVGGIQNSGTLVIGTEDGVHDATSPVITGAKYGVSTSQNITFYDGILKGPQASGKGAINDTNRITTVETGTQEVPGTETIGNTTYATLYYAFASGYNITLNTHGGSGVPASVTVSQGSAVASLPTPEYTNHYFDGWYTDYPCTTRVVYGTTTPSGDTTYHANWIPTVLLATVADDDLDVAVNGTATISVTNSASIESYTYSSADSSIASVTSAGVVTGNSLGVTTIYLTGDLSGEVYEVTVHVNIANGVVTHDIMSPAMREYYNNISTWIVGQSDTVYDANTNTDINHHQQFDAEISTLLSKYNCVNFNGDDRANKGASSGSVYCDLPNHYDTGVSGNVNVYEYDYVNDVVDNSIASYVTVNNGEIYNMIPGKAYYWESASDSTVNGKVYAYGERRLIQIDNLKSGSNDTYYQTRNVRDLGGIAVSYVDGNNNPQTGTIKYGKLFRGEKIWGGNGSSLQYFTKLGINHELDLRADSDPVTYDSEEDAFTPQYKILKPNSTYTYEIIHYGIDYSSSPSSNYAIARNAVIAIMNEFINDQSNTYSLYFHCRIGADRTGTIAYLLEGLLGVSDEERYRDYELTIFFGLDERTRFYYNKTTNKVKFTYMKNAIKNAGDGVHEDVLEWFLAGSGSQAQREIDLALVNSFRAKLIDLD